MTNNLIFSNNTVNFDNFDNNTNTLTINNENDNTYYITFDNYIPSNLTINVINSNVTIIENYLGNLEKSEVTINIDEHSKLNRFSILFDNTYRFEITRNINNKNYYQSMQIDLTKNSINSNENINLVKQEAYDNVIDGIYAVNESSKKY